AAMLICSALVYHIAIPICSLALTTINGRLVEVFYFAIALVAFLLGSIFPILCDASIKSDKAVGYSVAWIYLANIIGSTLGPLFSGFVLMDRFPLEDLFLYVS